MGKKIKIEKFCKSETSVSKRVVAFCMLVSYCLVLAPAKEFLMERDSADFIIDRYEIEKETLSEEEKSAVESALKGQVVCDDVFWGEYETDGTSQTAVYDSMLLIHKSKLYEMLLDAKKKFAEEKMDCEDASEFEKEWKAEAERIISEYLESCGFTGDKTELVSEFSDMERKLYNEVLSEYLYDHSSMKKNADENAASVVTDRLIAEVESDTQNNLDVLFDRLNKVSDYEETELKLEKDDWFESFQKYIDEGIEKWNEVETEFLEAKYAFESEAGEKYEQDIQKWADAYDELVMKREEWNKNIEERIEEGIVIWQQKSEKLNLEIDKAMEDYKNEILAEYRQKNEEFAVNCEIYTQTRTLLTTACNEVKDWIGVWADKYDGLYSYWKTEDNEENEIKKLKQIVNVNQDNCEEIKILIESIKSLYEKTVSDLKTQNNSELNYQYRDYLAKDQLLWSELELVDNWLNVISEYSDTLSECIKNLKNTAFDYSDNTYALSEYKIEYKRLENSLLLCQKEVEIAKAVYEYSKDNTSKVEKKETTEINLKNAESLTEKVNEEYKVLSEKVNDLRLEYENALVEYENQKQVVSDLLTELENAKIDYKTTELSISFTDLEAVKEKFEAFVNSINLINYDTQKNRNTLIDLINTIENYSYNSIYQNSEILIDREYSGYDVQYQDENGEMITCHVKGITELEKELEKGYDKEIVSMLNTKYETVNYLSYGKFDPGNYSDVDYEVIIDLCKNLSVDSCIENDCNVKNKIMTVIKDLKNNSNEYYLEKSDEEIELFFNELDKVVEDNLCSNFIKDEIDIYKTQILNARFSKQNFNENKDFFYQIDEVFGKSVNVNECKYDVKSYELFFDTNVSSYETISLTDEEYQILVNDLYNKLNENNYLYQEYFEQLMNCGSQLLGVYSIQNDSVNALEEVKQKVNLINEKYAQEVEKYNGNNANSYFSKLKKAIDNFNDFNLQVSEKYQEVEKYRHEEDICREIYNWAQNEYLHLDYEFDDMYSPEERYKKALTECEKAETEFNEYKSKINAVNLEDSFSLIDQNGNNILADYENCAKSYSAVQVFQYELEEALGQQQEKLYRAKQDVDNLVHNIIVETEEESFVLNDLVKRFVNISLSEENGNLKYEICFNDESESDKKEMLTYNDGDLYCDTVRKYVTEKNVSQYNCNDDELMFSKSAVDALEFLQNLTEKDYTIDDLLMALCYIKMHSGNEDLLFEGENPEIDSNYSLGSITENIEGVHVYDEYKDGRIKAVKNAYNKVVSNDGLDDIAKLIFYSSYNLSDNYELEKREIDIISICGMESLKTELSKEILTNQVIFASMTASAAVTAAAALAPFCKWLFAVAAAIQIAAAVYGVKAYDISCVKDDVNSIQKGYKYLYDEIIYNTDINVSRWINAKTQVETESLMLNKLLYGENDGDEELTFELFEKEIKSVLGKEKGSCIDYNYLENLYLFDKNITSLEDLYNIAVGDKKCRTTIEAVTYISEFIEKKYSESLNSIAETSDAARGEEDWNEILFQRETGKIAFDSLINIVPVKISRNQENYITEGLENIKKSYDAILSEYYSNLLIQKQNELNSKKEYFENQFSDWITCIKNVKTVAEAEWNKAEEQLNEKLQVWNKEWICKYDEIEKNYEDEYLNILKQKSEWINEKYTEQALGITLSAVEDEKYDSEIEKIRNEAVEIANSNKVFLLNKIKVPESDSLVSLSSFENISSSINSLNNEALKYSVSLFNAEKINFFDYEKNELIENTINSLNETMNSSAFALSAETAAKALNQKIDELYLQIEMNNKNFEQWEKELVLKDGYTYGKEISRDAIVHSVIFGGNIRNKQTVHKYEYFTCAGPEISFSYQNADSYDLFSLMMQNNYNSLNNWYENIFGSDQKKGLFAEHIGTEPLFVENVNIEKNRVENISNPGSGQLGLVMLDYIWNSIVNRNGYAEVATAMYDRKLTVENKFLGVELPTIRDITSIAFDIVANCTGQKWISVIDDVTFGITDLTLEQKTSDQVFLGLAASAASIGIGSAASSAVNTVNNSAMNQISKALITSGIKAAQSYTSSVASSYINAISFSDGFTIDWDKANSVWTDENAWKNSISSGATTLINGALNNLTLTDGTGRFLNDSYYNISAVQSLNSTLSAVAVSGTELLLSGTTTVNLLNAGGTGLLAMTISDDGVSAKISSDGHNLNIADAVNGISGIGDAAWVTGAKMSAAAGDENNVGLLNGINCLSYYSPERAGELAKEIWNGEKIVKIADMNPLGRTFGNVIEVSDKIAGNNDESAVQVASILLHEDAHSQGLDEFQARIVGYNLYANMSGVYDTSQNIYENVSDVAFFTQAYKQFGEEGLYMMMQLTDAFSHHNDGWDYYLAETIDSGIKQNLSDNNFIALGNSLIKKKIDEYNNAHIEESYEKYMKDGYQKYVKAQNEAGNENNCLSYEDFCSSGLLKYGDKSVFAKAILEKNKELSAYHFAEKDFVSIGDYGCVLSTATYITYSLTGELYSLREANDICKGADVFNGAYISWGEDYKNAVNALVGEEALTEYGRASGLEDKNNLLNDITESDDAYFVVARVLNDSHATLLKSQQDDYTYNGDKKTYNSLDVLNSWYSTNPNSKLGATNYKMSEVSNLTWYKVNGEYLNKYKNNAQYREAKMKEIKQRYAY